MVAISVKKLRNYVEERKQRGLQVREIQCPGDVESLLEGLPFQIDSQSDANIILKEDTFVELGPPNRASCVFILMSRNPSSVKDGRITLIGPDIQESAGKTLPIGQVLIVAGTGLRDKHYLELERCQYISNRLPGYMIRFFPRRMWSRVSKMAAENGFSFETLGRNLMALFKLTLPLIDAIEIIFITSGDADVEELSDIAKESRKKFVEIMKKRYDCTFAWSCDNCPYQSVCEEIKDMAELLKRIREGVVPLEWLNLRNEKED